MARSDTYHHGNLRRALLDESLKVIAEHGIERLSLREVASRVGVSSAAPYHHFADKAALLCALAQEGMAAMDARMAERVAEAGDDPQERLLAIGMAYVEFAVERPDYYAAFNAPEVTAAMYAAPPAPPAPGERRQGDTWQRLVDAVVACQEAGEFPQGDPTIIAVFLWSVVHGLAELWRAGPLPLMPQAAGGLEPLARQVLSASVGGLEAAAEQQSGAEWRPCGED